MANANVLRSTSIDRLKFVHSYRVHFEDVYHVIILTFWRLSKTHRYLET